MFVTNLSEDIKPTGKSDPHLNALAVTRNRKERCGEGEMCPDMTIERTNKLPTKKPLVETRA